MVNRVILPRLTSTWASHPDVRLVTGSAACDGGSRSVKRFTLYGSPHSLPTYKVALMLRLSGEPFSFRYVSFQKGMHKTPEFLALSRWGQVPVLVEAVWKRFLSPTHRSRWASTRPSEPIFAASSLESAWGPR